MNVEDMHDIIAVCIDCRCFFSAQATGVKITQARGDKTSPARLARQSTGDCDSRRSSDSREEGVLLVPGVLHASEILNLNFTVRKNRFKRSAFTT